MTCLLAWDLRSFSKSWVKRFTWALWVRVSKRLEPIPRICKPNTLVIYTHETLADPDFLMVLSLSLSLSLSLPLSENKSFYVWYLHLETQRPTKCRCQNEQLLTCLGPFFSSHTLSWIVMNTEIKSMLSAWATNFVSKRQLKFCRPFLQAGSYHDTLS